MRIRQRSAKTVAAEMGFRVSPMAGHRARVGQYVTDGIDYSEVINSKREYYELPGVQKDTATES